MAITFLCSFALTVSTMTVAISAQAFAPLQFAGVNIAGFGEHYTCIVTRHVQTPVPQTSVVVQMALALSHKLSPLSTNYLVGGFFYGEPSHTLIYPLGVDGLGQMQHFVKDDGYNVFRLPVGWQYLTYNQSTGVLNETQFSNYNMLVSDCLSTGAYCEIDIHNYARYDGQVSERASVIVMILNDIIDYRSRWSKQRNLRRALVQHCLVLETRDESHLWGVCDRRCTYRPLTYRQSV
jgi:endoglucanase